MSDRKFYTAKPFDVVFFRGNKPFNSGEWLTEGIFPPLPSTFQGMIRTAILAKNGCIGDNGNLINPTDNGEEPKAYARKLVGNDAEFPFDIQGPFITEDKKIYLPTPKDIAKLGDNGSYIEQNLDYSSYSTSDFDDKEMKLSGEKVKQKYLHWEKELITINDFFEYVNTGRIASIETEELPYEKEMHHGIEIEYKDKGKKTKRTKESQFYLTPYVRLKPDAKFHFTFEAENDERDYDITNLHGRLGSEARGVYIEESERLLNPGNRQTIYQQIAQDGRLKIILLTPGVFEHGWIPLTNGKVYGYDVSIKLYHAINETPIKISGISQLKQKDNGKKDGRLKFKELKPQVIANPAGSVYYYKINEGSEEDIIKWLGTLDFSKIKNEPYSKMGYNQIVIGKILHNQEEK